MSENSSNAVLLEQLRGLNTLITTKFDETHKRLDKINGRVDKHDNLINEALIERSKNREEQKALIPNHIITCPNGADMRNISGEVINCKNKIMDISKDLVKVDEDLKEVNNLLKDISFFARNPKLFFAIVVTLTILSLGTFITNNPLKIFDKIIPNTEQTINR